MYINLGITNNGLSNKNAICSKKMLKINRNRLNLFINSIFI